MAFLRQANSFAQPLSEYLPRGERRVILHEKLFPQSRKSHTVKAPSGEPEEQTMQVASLIIGKVAATIGPSASIEELVNKLKDNNVGALVVTSDGHAIEGIVSERDIVRAMPGQTDSLFALKVRDLMSTRVFTCTTETSVAELMHSMTEKRIRHVPVVDALGNLLSIVSIGDVVKIYLEELINDRNALQGYIVAG
jgi:CBS domain-containing protein